MERRIKQVRAMNKLNQAEFAEKIGVTMASISAYETGVRKPSNSTIAVICDKFGINETWLRTGEGEMMQETPRTIVDALAKEYNLTPAVTALLDAVARAFVELDDSTAQRIVDKLAPAITAATSAEHDAAAVREAIEKSPDESGRDATA